ncbi:MAG: hypothetical protein LWW87_13400 [Geobacteraceae bacterium]|nr:hypothetical protein [Geobacteraceae bacterium]
MSNQMTNTEPELVRCPKCDAVQQLGDACKACGLIFSKYRTPDAADQVRQPTASATEKEQTLGVRPVHILLTLVAILIAILAYKLPVKELYADLIQTRKWSYDLSSFHKGQTQDELATMMNKDGFEVKCREYPGVAKEDVFICQVFITKVWGIPASEVDLFFSRDKMLNSLLFTFAADQYPAVSQKLGQQGSKSNEDHGIDNEGGKVDVWNTGSGVAMSSSAPIPAGIRVYWVRNDLENNNEGQSVRK